MSTDRRAALAELLNARGAALYGYATALCRDPTEGRDLLQEVLVSVLSRRQSPSGDMRNIEAYVRSSLVRRYIDGQRRETRSRYIRQMLGAGSGDGVDDHGQAETRIDVFRALQPLSPMQRACVLRYYYDDQPISTIAGELRCSEGGVKRHLADARDRLALSLQEYSQNGATT
jgi:RNA polymerase sigma factor (sigma-70 family)